MRASQEAPVFPQRLGYAKRMMGLEPTTFCMASRCSSQLSYIRALASIAVVFSGAPSRPVARTEDWRLVHAGEHRARLS
jgi:hypothetical protein